MCFSFKLKQIKVQKSEKMVLKTRGIVGRFKQSTLVLLVFSLCCCVFQFITSPSNTTFPAKLLGQQEWNLNFQIAWAVSNPILRILSMMGVNELGGIYHFW